MDQNAHLCVAQTSTHRIQAPEVKCAVFTVNDDLRSYVFGSKVSTTVYEQIVKHFKLYFTDKLKGDVDFIFQKDLASAQTATGSSAWFNDHLSLCLTG